LILARCFMAEAELVVDLARAEAVAEDWDALAVACGMPMSSPAWMLGWWRHLAPRSAALRIVVVRDRKRVIGIVPLYADLGRRSMARSYRLLAHNFASVLGPLAWSDREWEVAEATAGLLAARELRPQLIELGPMPACSPWTVALRERWPAPMRPLCSRRVLRVPIVSLQGRRFDDWLAERRAHFRANTRRWRRLFEQAGGTYRLADGQSISADLAIFAELHARRWQGPGRRSRLAALGERLTELLGEIADRLLAKGRFRLLLLELDSQPICADLCLAAGGEVVTFNYGWDERHRRISPPLLALLHTIEDSCARGERRIDLGWGDNVYKEQFANGSDAVTWDTLLPPGAQLAGALPRVLPELAGWRATQTTKRILRDEQVSRLREVRATVVRFRG